MKMKIKLWTVIVFITATGIAGCKKVETGYLSDNIRYASNPVTVNQGVFAITQGIIPDASTPPFKITLLDIRNKETGKREESFFKEHEIILWKKPYDPRTDTTLELINAKQQIEKKLAFYILEKSGQFMFTQATDSVPTGDYLVDMKVENPRGSKTYEGITSIRINPAQQFLYTYENVPYFIALPSNSETPIRFAYDDAWVNPAKGQSTNTTLTITRLADGPNQIILKVIDKNGKVFPGKALERRPYGTGYLKTLETFAYKTTVTDTAILYDYAKARFPDVYWDTQGNGTNCYYRIYEKWIESIDYADPTAWNPPNDLNYLIYTEKPVKINIRFNTRLHRGGKYRYELKLKATMKQQPK